MKNKTNSPKTVSINLKSASKNKSPSNSPPRDKFKMPINKLRKTFDKDTDLFQKIRENNEQQAQLHKQ